VGFIEVSLSLVDHACSLLIVKGLLVLDNHVVRLDDDCDQEVHEDNEDQEGAQDENHESQQHSGSGEPILVVSFGRRVNNKVEPFVHVDNREVPHRASEDRQEICQQSWGSTVKCHVNFQEMEALCEGE